MGKVRLILGLAGTGKTTRLRESMRACCEKGKEILVFVPDQFSFDTEKALYIELGAKNISRVKVTSFSRISREILIEAGVKKPYADEVVKRVTMLTALDQLKGSLSFYRSLKDANGFAGKLMKTAASFKNAGLTPSDLTKKLNDCDEMDGVLFEKTSDLSLIYSAYDELLTKNLDDKLDDVRRAAEIATQTGRFNNCVCFFDNFDSFSNAQRRLLEVIISQSENAEFCLTTDAPNSSERRFFCINKTIEEIKGLCEDVSCEICEDFSPSCSNELYISKTPYDEAVYIAARIRDEVIKGARYRDFLVLTADRAYQGALENALQTYEVPYFSDFPDNLTSRPAVSFILTLLKALSLETPDLLRYFESGFVRVTNEKTGKPTTLKAHQAAKLRNAAEKYSLRRENWIEQFVDSEKIKLSHLEALRKELIEQLTDLDARLEAAQTGQGKTEVLADFLINVQHLDSTFIGRSKKSGGEETDELLLDKTTASEYERIWETIVEILESLSFCTGDIRMTTEQFVSVLTSVLEATDIASPPRVLDCVTLGDIERTRKASPKFVLMCGFNEGAIPRRLPPTNAFSSADEQALRENGIDVGDTRAVRFSKELYFTYRAMSLPRERLIMTCCETDFSGREALLASILEEMKLEKRYTSDLEPEFFASTVKSAKQVLAQNFGKNHDITKKLSAVLDGEKRFVGLLENAQAIADGKAYSHKIPPQSAEKLYQLDRISPTAIEKAFSCPFAFFCSYGLGIRNELSADISEPIETGNAVHHAMQEAIGRFIEKNDGFDCFLSLSDDELSGLSRDALSIAAEEYLHKSCADEKRVRGITGLLEPRLTSLLKQLKTDILCTGFVPVATEKKLEYSSQCGIVFYGTADRIDVKLRDSERYIRICDYKTGNNEVSLEALKHGLGLQMFIYMFACLEHEGKFGAVQYTAAGGTGCIKSSSIEQETVNRDYAFLDSHRISTAYSEAVNEGYLKLNDELAAQAGKTSRTAFVKSNSLNEAEIEKIREDFEKNLLPQKTESIRNGEAKAFPVTIKGKELPCDYCDYKNICKNKNGVFDSLVIGKEENDEN